MENELGKDIEAKLQFIKAYFDELDEKIKYLDTLFQNNHREEALLLCCCYIEGLGNSFYWPDKKGCWQNFVSILIKHGGNEIFGYIHPIQLQRVLASTKNSKHNNKIGEKTEPHLSRAKLKLYSQEEIVGLVRPALTQDDLTRLQEGLWKGTFAAIAYENLRNLLVHSLGAIDVSFSGTTFQGQSVPTIDFLLLYDPLKQIFRDMKQVSLESGRWFGHDFEACKAG